MVWILAYCQCVKKFITSTRRLQFSKSGSRFFCEIYALMIELFKMLSRNIFDHLLAIFCHFLVIFCLFLSPTQTVIHLLALINTFSLGVIISAFIYCEIDVLPTFRTENCVIFSLISMIFCYWKVYGASPTEIEKKWFFSDFGETIFFSDHFFRFFFYKFKKLYIDESWEKNSSTFGEN